MSSSRRVSIRVLLVDDHPLVLEGITTMLLPFSDIEIVGTAATAAEALTTARATRPQVVLLDLLLPDGDGIDVCRQLLAEQPALRVIALTILKDLRYLLRIREAGAAGYMLKNVLPDELVFALRKVYAGKVFFSDEMQELLASTEAVLPTPLLTRREKEVLAFVAKGMTSHEIAKHLSINYLTIDTHRRNLLAKFGVNNTVVLLKLAAEQGLV